MGVAAMVAKQHAECSALDWGRRPAGFVQSRGVVNAIENAASSAESSNNSPLSLAFMHLISMLQFQNSLESTHSSHQAGTNPARATKVPYADSRNHESLNLIVQATYLHPILK